LSEEELDIDKVELDSLRKESENGRTAHMRGLRLQIDQIQERLERLSDALIDGTIDKNLFATKQNVLLMEQVRMKEQLAETEKGSRTAIDNLERTVGLAKSPSVLYKTASPEKKRELLRTLLSDLTVSGKNVDISLANPFRIIAEREKTLDG
jgi:hypothetical protein